MNTASEELKKLRLMAKRTFEKTDALEKVLAHVEAKLARAES